MMKHCFSTEVVDLDNQAPNRNKRESKYFWDELIHLMAAGGFKSIEIPYEPKWDFGGRSGIPRSLRSITTKFGTVRDYMVFLKENGIDSVDCIHLNPSLFCRENASVYFGAFRHYAEEVIGFAKEAGCEVVTFTATPPYYAVSKLPDGEAEETFPEETKRLFTELAEKASEANVTICLKNEFWGLLRGEKIAAFLSGLPDSVKLDVDTANLAVAGVDVKRFIRDNKDCIGIVHFTDSAFVDRDETWKTALPEFPAAAATKVFTDMGEGNVDLKGIYETLYEIGYDGTIVFNPRNSFDISRSILRTRYFIDSVLA